MEKGIGGHNVDPHFPLDPAPGPCDPINRASIDTRFAAKDRCAVLLPYPELPLVLIQVSHYSFELSEPFVEGQRLSAGEAHALNALRAERLRQLMQRKVAQASPRGTLLDAEGVAALAVQAQEADRLFSFPPKQFSRIPKSGLRREIELLGQERWAEAFRKTFGQDPTEEQLAGALLDLPGFGVDLNEPTLVEEAHRRYAAKNEVLKNAMADLMGEV